MYYTTPGQENNEIAKFIYKSSRRFVNGLVEVGQIHPKDSEVEFAKKVAKELTHYGMPVPKKLLALIPIL